MKRTASLIVPVSLMLYVVAGCGSESDSPDVNYGDIYIMSPSDTRGDLVTTADNVFVTGRAFSNVRLDNTNCPNFNTEEVRKITGVTVTYVNFTTGWRGNVAQIADESCGLFGCYYFHSWWARVTLAPGLNNIEFRANDFKGGFATDTMIVTRQQP